MCLEYQTACLGAAAARRSLAPPGLMDRARHPSRPPLAFYLAWGSGTVSASLGLLLMGVGGATSLSQRCSDKPLQPWADKGLKGEGLHMVQMLLFLICYSDTQLTANLL